MLSQLWGLKNLRGTFLSASGSGVSREAVLECCLGLQSSHGLTGEHSAFKLPYMAVGKPPEFHFRAHMGLPLGLPYHMAAGFHQREIPRQSKKEHAAFL